MTDRDEQIIKSVHKFWEVEDIGMAETDNLVEQEFLQPIKIEDKRYTVKLPWKTDPEILPDNYSLAKDCLTSYRRLLKSPERLKQYDDIIRDQELEGIVEKVDPVIIPKTGRTHYIPHREIIKEKKYDDENSL